MIQPSNYTQIQKIYLYLKKQRENRKFLNYIEVSVTFTLISLLLFFAILPTTTAISGLMGEIKSKELFNKKMMDKINSVVIAQDIYSKVQEKYSVIESCLPTQPRLYSAASNFSVISQQSGVNLENISFDISSFNRPETPSKSNITSYDINITSNSNFQSIINYLNKILQSRRLTNLESIQLSIDENQVVSNSNINLNLKTKLFYIK